MHSHKVLKRSLVLAAFAVFLAASAVAQEYQILRADYGYGNQRVDVTQRLRELARADRTFRMGNSTFGVDPSPGNVKSLRIIARDPNGGGEQIFEYREGSTVDGSRFSGWSGGNWGGGGGFPGGGGGFPGGGGGREYQILRAFYGYAGRNVDVTQRLRELARSDNSFRMGNSTFGVDPAPGHIKTLRIYARDPGSGRDQMFEYREGSTVDGSQFSGWGGGNWGDNNWNGGWQGRPGNGDGDEGGNYPGNRSQLTILRATYGAPGRTRDVTERLRARMRNGRLSMRVDNESMGGDPAPDATKRLYVSYSVRGQQREADVPEGREINIP